MHLTYAGASNEAAIEIESRAGTSERSAVPQALSECEERGSAYRVTEKKPATEKEVQVHGWGAIVSDRKTRAKPNAGVKEEGGERQTASEPTEEQRKLQSRPRIHTRRNPPLPRPRRRFRSPTGPPPHSPTQPRPAPLSDPISPITDATTASC